MTKSLAAFLTSIAKKSMQTKTKVKTDGAHPKLSNKQTITYYPQNHLHHELRMHAVAYEPSHFSCLE